MSSKAKGSKAKDPYYRAKQNIEDKMLRIQTDYEQWKFILENKNTATDFNFDKLNKSVRQSIKEFNNDVRNLSQVISVVEKSRGSFAHIDDLELTDRKNFVNNSKTRIENIERVLDSEKTRVKIQSDQRKEQLGSTAGAAVSSGPRGTQGEQVVSNKREVMQMQEREQDEVLDDMSSALDRLNINAQAIGSKLEVHAELTGEMERHMDKSETMIAKNMHKMENLLNRSRSGRLLLLFLLFAISLTLQFFIIYG